MLSRLWYPKRDSFLLSPFSVSVSSLFFGFLHLLLPCSTDFICRKLSKDRKAVLASFLFLFFFFSIFFLIFLFYSLPSQPHSNTGEGKKLPLFSAFFFSPTSLSYFSSTFSFLLLPPRLVKGLYSLNTTLI